MTTTHVGRRPGRRRTTASAGALGSCPSGGRSALKKPSIGSGQERKISADRRRRPGARPRLTA
ncbi:MAG: hypothetical protein MZU84_06020 [Sphingobacterium sp.]|nr:hypothetical protein [Sphingobacterium sp.]